MHPAYGPEIAADRDRLPTGIGRDFVRWTSDGTDLLERGADRLDDVDGAVGHVLPGEVEHRPSEQLHVVPALVVVLTNLLLAVDGAVCLDPDPERRIRKVESSDATVGSRPPRTGAPARAVRPRPGGRRSGSRPLRQACPRLRSDARAAHAAHHSHCVPGCCAADTPGRGRSSRPRVSVGGCPSRGGSRRRAPPNPSRGRGEVEASSESRRPEQESYGRDQTPVHDDRTGGGGGGGEGGARGGGGGGGGGTERRRGVRTGCRHRTRRVQAGRSGLMRIVPPVAMTCRRVTRLSWAANVVGAAGRVLPSSPHDSGEVFGGRRARR